MDEAESKLRTSKRYALLEFARIFASKEKADDLMILHYSEILYRAKKLIQEELKRIKR